MALAIAAELCVILIVGPVEKGLAKLLSKQFGVKGTLDRMPLKLDYEFGSSSYSSSWSDF